MVQETELFNTLPPHVWPRHARRQEDGVVTIAGVPLPEIAEEYGTPVLVVDEDDFRSRCRDMAAAYGGPENVHYACKAFMTSHIVRWVDEEGLCLDVASLGELEVALRAGFPAERITAHGNNKDEHYLERCVESGIGHVVLDSAQELERLEAVAAREGATQDVLVRVKPGIEAHTHEFIATSHEDQKFGFSLASGSAYEAARACAESESLRLVGLHCHVGSQVFDAEGFSLAAERVLGLYDRLIEDLGLSTEVFNLLDLGGGYGIAYCAEDRPLDVESVAHDLRTRVAQHAENLGIESPTIMVEPGRAIAGPSTVTMYSVGTVKDVHYDDERTRRYLAVDGGMSDNIRPILYGAEYDARLVNRFAEGDPVLSRLVGSHCESGDILVQDAEYPGDIEAGDLIAIAATGAYCWSMSSRYNMMGRPAIVVVRGGESRLIVRRETIDDLIALEVSAG
ncbi:diaminopimelate decarboxylase [Corynebacterium uropygiale]|uniref:Diaminopimelate decarboxylase n=1 Tax=Corynebacterium uropygiale TaxID=1775911 RepID=A0A9X1TY60_9CORY|nr:diaminopimelate decarboxylase [Corynebacterium uropygiale]MCF4006935.1 diaminopimelate decarboxylase [Corynebacterium uropygiale]